MNAYQIREQNRIIEFETLQLFINHKMSVQLLCFYLMSFSYWVKQQIEPRLQLTV